MQTGHSGPPSNDRFGETTNIPDTKVLNATIMDATKLKLVLKSEVTAPPYYHGDCTDKCSMMEWEELI